MASGIRMPGSPSATKPCGPRGTHSLTWMVGRQSRGQLLRNLHATTHNGTRIDYNPELVALIRFQPIPSPLEYRAIVLYGGCLVGMMCIGRERRRSSS